jgi:hypothetical protein
MKVKTWMETRLRVTQILLASVTMVSMLLIPTTGWPLFLTIVGLFYLASRLNKSVAIEFYDIGEKTGILTKAEKLVVLQKSTGLKIENPVIIIYDSDTHELIDDCIIAFEDSSQEDLL